MKPHSHNTTTVDADARTDEGRLDTAAEALVLLAVAVAVAFALRRTIAGRRRRSRRRTGAARPPTRSRCRSWTMAAVSCEDTKGYPLSIVID